MSTRLTGDHMLDQLRPLDLMHEVNSAFERARQAAEQPQLSRQAIRQAIGDARALVTTLQTMLLRMGEIIHQTPGGLQEWGLARADLAPVLCALRSTANQTLTH